MAKAICRIPHHAKHMSIDSEWRLLFTIKALSDPGECEKPEETIKNLMPCFRSAIDCDNNWHKSGRFQGSCRVEFSGYIKRIIVMIK